MSDKYEALLQEFLTEFAHSWYTVQRHARQQALSRLTRRMREAARDAEDDRQEPWAYLVRDLADAFDRNARA